MLDGHLSARSPSVCIYLLSCTLLQQGQPLELVSAAMTVAWRIHRRLGINGVLYLYPAGRTESPTDLFDHDRGFILRYNQSDCVHPYPYTLCPSLATSLRCPLNWRCSTMLHHHLNNVARRTTPAHSLLPSLCLICLL